MHIAFAGGGIQTISLADGLNEERSQSVSSSVNWDKPTEKHIYGPAKPRTFFVGLRIFN
jgi:outer membrane receptor for ferrienterochelin and colicins